MRTALIIVAGLVLLGVFLVAGRCLGGAAPRATAIAAKTFIPVWLAGALANMWMGVAGAGYSIREELPIFLFIFALPASAALLVGWKSSSSSRGSR